MFMGEALLERLKADSAISAIAGNRIYWEMRPQSAPGNALPAVVLFIPSGSRPQDLDGFQDMATATVQASCFAPSYGQSRQLAEAVIAAAVPEWESANIVFWGGSADEPRDLGNQTETGFVFHAAVDLTVRWARTS